MQHLSDLGTDNLALRRLGAIRCSSKILEHISDVEPNFYSFADGKYGYYQIDENGHSLKPENPPLQRESGVLTRSADDWSENDFVQRWLYFEVLREIFRDLKEFNVRDFTMPTERGLIITTAPMKGLLQIWRTRLIHAENSLDQIIRAQDILFAAKSYATKYLSWNHETLATGNPVRWQQVTDEVALSILILGETLSAALNIIQQEKGFMLRGWSNQSNFITGWGYSVAVLKALSEKGWGSSTIELLKGIFKNSTIGILHVLALRDPPKISTQTDANYEPYHPCIDGTAERCKPVTIKRYETVINIIEAGEIPLFRYNTKLEELTVERISLTDRTTEYIIFSHVWADGFGNPTKNELPRCVLRMLAGLHWNGRPRRGRKDPKKVPETSCLFWIDTLAVPVAEEYKDARESAIGMMHTIYKQARFTYMLDRELLGTSKSDEFTHPAMMISLCNWSQRLWTLQEAVLSNKIYFTFKDHACTLEDIEGSYRRIEGNLLHTPAPAITKSNYATILGPGRDEFLKSLDGNKIQAISKVWKAAQWRTTTHLRHETLSFATLLNLDTTPFVKSSHRIAPKAGSNSTPDNEQELNESMQQFWSLLREKEFPIPVEFMFLPGPYLPYAGYRWAPRSWLSHQRVEHPDVFTMSGPTAKFIENIGLQVNLPGIRLRGLERNYQRLKDVKEFRFATDRLLLDWYVVQMADITGSWFRDKDLEGTQGLAIIHLETNMAEWNMLHGRAIALLVTILGKSGNPLEVNILSRIYIQREVDPRALQECKAQFRQPDALPLCYGEILPPMQAWQVDGTDRSENPEPLITSATGEQFQEAVEGAGRTGMFLPYLSSLFAPSPTNTTANGALIDNPEDAAPGAMLHHERHGVRSRLRHGMTILKEAFSLDKY